ncbi:MAG: PKD domain-containing protein [Thermoplasmata archaeon]|nr:PKD domain-containing protein [Thermoplasmata archaeon]
MGGGQIVLNAPGSVTANDYRLTLVRIVVSPPSGGHLLFDSVSHQNGATLNVTNNSVHSIFARANPGYVFLSFGGAPIGNLTVQGNTLIVNGSGTLTVNLEHGSGTAFVGFQTDPPGCGTVEFDGVNYSNSQFTNVVPNVGVSIAPWPCNGFGFVKWLTSGGVTINGSTAIVSPVGGSIKAEFHALAGVHVFTAPIGCGTVFLAGVPYTNGAVVSLPIFAWSLLSERPCSGFHFTGWDNSTGSTVNATSIYIVGPTLLTATYTRNTYPVTVLVVPASCGSLRVGGTAVFNNTTLILPAGAYHLTSSPCPTNDLLGFNASGNVSVANSTLTVSGAGSIAVNYGPVPPQISLVVPTSAYVQDSVLLSVQVAVPVAPYTYTYEWGFGDGGGAATQANFTNHVYSTTGNYLVTVKVTDPYGRVVHAEGNLSINTAPPVSNTLPAAGFVVIGILAILIITALALAVRRRSTAAGGGSTPSPPPPNVQEPPTLPPGAVEPLSISSGKEIDAENEAT